jgi:hypothetical protein
VLMPCSGSAGREVGHGARGAVKIGRVQAKSSMRHTGKKQAIRNAFHRLGLHAKPTEVVQVLALLGVQVDEELVRLVRIELLKRTPGGNSAKVSTLVKPPAVRRCPKGFPRRGRGT